MLRVSTTTSLYATGLLDMLSDKFSEKYPNIRVEFIAVGSGAALRLAEKGDVDMILVHAPNLEVEYIDKGVIVDGKIFAYNTFVIVGPSDDPAGISGKDPIIAMTCIYDACERGEAVFVSRGDESGTHQRELLLWSLAGLDPQDKEWYVETGTGMSETLLYANERNAYTLSDIGTYLKLKSEGRLAYLTCLVDQGRELMNIYSVYIVNYKKYTGVRKDIAEKFMEFLLSDEGQELIGNYGKEEYGQPLFYPAKGEEDELRECWEWFAEA